MKKVRRNDKTFRRAYSLAELILGAAVIAGFSVRIFQAYSATSDSDKFTKLVDELNLVVGTSRSVFIQTLDYNSFSTDMIKNSIPRSYVDDSAKPTIINTPYAQPITFTPTKTADGLNGGLELQFSMPRILCQRLAVGADALYDYLSIDGGTVYQSPIAAQDATSACSGASADVIVALTFTGGANAAAKQNGTP